MYLPTQSHPVQRAMNTEAGAYHGPVSGIGPNALAQLPVSGVQPSDTISDILNIVKTVGGVAGPILGALGI